MSFGKLLCLISAILLSALSPTLFSKEGFGIGDLINLPPLPEKYESYDYNERIAWLENELGKTHSPAETYRLARELAFQYDWTSSNELILSVCQSNKPIKADIDYRFYCISSIKKSDESKLDKLTLLLSDAIDLGNLSIAAQSLSSMAWIQSSLGDIEQAFRSYEMAMELASDENIYLRSDITLNLSQLYIMHGDGEYFEKGVKLVQGALDELRSKSVSDSLDTIYVKQTLANGYFNLGIAYMFHKPDYREALKWFAKVDPDIVDIRQSVLVFSSLAYTELNEPVEAKKLLQESYETPQSQLSDSTYLLCYQQIIKAKIDMNYNLERCSQLGRDTPLEVQLDIYSRLIESEIIDAKRLGYDRFYALYQNTLKSLLKQNSVKSASRSELNRLQHESRLKDQVIEREKQLAIANEEKAASQNKLTIAIVVVFLLVLLLVLLQLRQKKLLAKQYAQLSLVDGLTGLNNRRFFEQNIDRELKFVLRDNEGKEDSYLGVYIFDIDHFKKVNDNYGHDIGDVVLKEFSRRIRESVRESDMFVRWGGEEFLLASRVSNIECFHQLADRIVKTINHKPFEVAHDTSLDVSCTVGGIIYPGESKRIASMTWKNLVTLADNALYIGKRKQRNCWVCIDDINNLDLLSDPTNMDLDVAIDSNHVSVTHSMSSGESQPSRS